MKKLQKYQPSHIHEENNESQSSFISNENFLNEAKATLNHEDLDKSSPLN